MTSPYPPYQPPRKLERSRDNRVIGGVCGGLGDYLNMDPTMVRALTVLISLFTGVPIILYLIALFVVPEQDSSGGPRNYPPVQGGPQWTYGNYSPESDQSTEVPPGQPAYPPAPGPQQSRPSAYGATSGGDTVWGPDGAPWEQRPDDAGGRRS